MQFIHLNVLFLMLIPSFILMFLIITKQNKLNSYFSKDALNKLSVSNHFFSNKVRNIILFLSLIFMIIALARPVSDEKVKSLESELNAVIIAIDVSKSMNAIDIYPNRLEFAKNKLLNILDSSKTEAIGIVLFAKSSFLLSALTQDFTSLKLLINNLDSGINFDNGTNIFSTLETTNNLLKNYQNKNLILLTDGGDNDNFEKEIEFANKNNISVYTLALATKKGSAIKEENGNFLTDSKGNIVNVKLNENIKQLSLKTNGGYINYSLNNNDIDQILKEINSKSKKEKFLDKKHKTYTELFYYPLAFALFLLLIAFSSLPSISSFSSIFKNKSLCLFFISSFFIFDTELKASSILDFMNIKKAQEAYENQEYDKASKEFKKLDSNEFRDYNLANSYYKSNDFDKAIELYKNIETTSNNLEFKKFHNLGNSYANKNDFQNAIKSYEKALKFKNSEETKENLEILKEALKENKKQDQNNQDNQDNQNNQNNQDNENKKDQDNKNENKKEEKQNKKENKNNSEEEKNKNKNEQKTQSPKENNNSQINSSKNEKMSDLEEEKWMKEIENQKTNSLLKKMQSSNNDSSFNPW